MPLAYDALPVHGRQGILTANIDGNVEELAEIKTFTATISFNKEEWAALGDMAQRHKGTTWNGSGSATYHWVSPRFVRMIIQAAKTGVLPYFDLVGTNDDPASSAGTQTIKMGQVSIDGGDIFKLDIDETSMEGSFDFTFSEVDGLDYFNDL